VTVKTTKLILKAIFGVTVYFGLWVGLIAAFAFSVGVFAKVVLWVVRS
jgi:hypothetical protein